MELKGKKIVVVGLGKSGQAAAKFLLRQGAKVFATDSAEIKVSLPGVNIEINGHTEEFLSGAELIVLSPGVKPGTLPVQWALQNHVPVISELELAYQYSKGEIAAITGTNGKTTSVSLLSAILKRAGEKSILAGNIGNPFIEALDELTDQTKTVLEVSSFQLKWTSKFQPKIATILNFSTNHLDWHASMDEYLNDKLKICQSQKKDDYLILNYDDPVLRKIKIPSSVRVLYYSLTCQKCSAYIKDDMLTLALDKEEKIANKEEVLLKGNHNLGNALAVSLMAGIWGVAPAIIADELKEFKGLEHRCEFIEPINKITFINDSKSTTVASTISALEIFKDPVILIAGGRDKGSDFSVLEDVVRKKVKALYLIGEAAPKIKDSLKDVVPIIESPGLKEVVQEVFNKAEPGDNVLFSPMCASFDMFSSYAERGDKFKQELELIRKTS